MSRRELNELWVAFCPDCDDEADWLTADPDKVDCPACQEPAEIRGRWVYAIDPAWRLFSDRDACRDCGENLGQSYGLTERCRLQHRYRRAPAVPYCHLHPTPKPRVCWTCARWNRRSR